jgi:hypothetical protein
VDTNPFATNPGTGQAQPSTPSYLQQQNNPSIAGGAANMLKALLAGNQQYQQKQAMGGGGMPNPTTTTGGPSVGAPMSLSPPQDPTNPMGMAGGMGGNPAGAPMPQQPMGGASPFTTGTSPVGVDPVTQALFSPIPGGGM